MHRHQIGWGNTRNKHPQSMPIQSQRFVTIVLEPRWLGGILPTSPMHTTGEITWRINRKQYESHEVACGSLRTQWHQTQPARRCICVGRPSKICLGFRTSRTYKPTETHLDTWHIRTASLLGISNCLVTTVTKVGGMIGTLLEVSTEPRHIACSFHRN